MGHPRIRHRINYTCFRLLNSVFIEPKGSAPLIPKPAIDYNPEPISSTSYPPSPKNYSDIGLQSHSWSSKWPIPRGFPTNILWALLAKCQAHPFLYFTVLTVLGDLSLETGCSDIFLWFSHPFRHMPI
jgi:hypothetical protein